MGVKITTKIVIFFPMIVNPLTRNNTLLIFQFKKKS
jgi:hypothetical protein